MAPSRRKGSARAAAAAAAAAAQHQWKVGDLVLAKMKGFPAWPAMISEPEKWGFSSVRKKLLVYFYGTEQIAFCNYADIEAFTEEKKKSLLMKRQGKGADFVRAIDEIIDVYEALKKQTGDEFIPGDEDIAPADENLEITGSTSFRKNPEHSSHIADGQKSGAVCGIENHNVFSSEEISATSVEADPHNINSTTDEPAEKASILDQLRQTPLASSTTSRRKRLRDAPLQSFIAQKRITPLRRSKNSSSSNPLKVKESDILHNDSDSAGGNVTTDRVQEESMINRSAENMPHTSDFHDMAVPVTAGFPKSGSSEDAASVTDAIKYQASNWNEGVVLDPSCKIEVSANGCLENEVRQNGQLDVPTKTMIFKKKRKPNRKRASNRTGCARLDKDTELQVALRRGLSESPNSHSEINEMDHKADGDEHLPLVKRARVRMGKPLVEEKQFDELLAADDKSEASVMINNSDKYSTVTNPRNNCLDNGTSLWFEEDSNASPINDCSHPSGSGLMLWKAKKYQLKSFTLDVEAALPPSKRLHRALEAMSANSTEATDDCPGAPRPMEVMPSGCMVSSKTSSLHLSTDGNIESPTRLHDTQSTECNAFSTSAARLSSQNLDVPTLASSEVKTDNINTKNLRSPDDKHCNEILVDVKNCGGSSVSKIVDAGIHDESMQPCSFRLTEKQVNPTYCEGMPDRSLSLSGKVNKKEIVQPEEECPRSPVNDLSGDQTGDPAMQKPDPVLNTKGGNDSLPPNVAISATNGSSTSGTSGATKSSSIQSDDDTQTHDMEDVAREVRPKLTPRDRCISPDLTPMKDLIAAAQAKRLLCRSTSFSDYFVDYKFEAVMSPSLVNKADSFVQGSPSNPMINHASAHTSVIDDRLQNPRNSSRSPHGGLRQKSLSKLTDHSEAYAVRKSFEALLCTLTRTKESIGRATRLAIECAKYGIAGEVVDILLQNLERESSLYRRVDLFFLVDSITQCSRSQKGGAGDVYPALVQSALPRLLSAAAPPGNAAWENRRQCLKVLRLWLERKTLPESIIRQHIRELDSVNEASFASTFSRRPSRTERALNDPVREMEGMLVDEYGSNTSFQLPCLLCTTVLEDEEASASDEKSFEAVTPERHAAVDHEKGIAQISTEKHRHILEDVDGELEMEDVAPCEVEVSSSCYVSGSDTTCNTDNQPDQHHSLHFAPPLPEDRPPSPPPLPSSPPPCSTALSALSQHESGSRAVADTADLHHSSITHNMQNQQSHSIGQQPSNLNSNLMSSESVMYYTPGYGGRPKQMPPPAPSLNSTSYGILPVSHPAIHSGNDFQSRGSAPMTNKAYHLQPPPPTVSNQFSYVQADPQQRAQPWGNCSAFTERFQYVHDVRGGNFYGDRGARGPVQQEIVDRGKFSPAFHSGPSVSDKVETSPAPLSCYGPPSDPPVIPGPGWPPRLRMSSYPVPASRPSLESPVSRVAGAPGYWRPR